MQPQEALQAIGLNEKESAVYMALLQLGKASAYSVALKSGLKKPTTYVVLDGLIRKGLVQKVPRAKKQQYVARSPEEAFAVAEEKLSLAKQKLPELLAMAKGEAKKVTVAYFEGLNGIKQLMEYRIKEMAGKETVGFYATDFGAPQELRDYFTGWNEKNKRLKIPVRGIVPEHPSLAQYRATDAERGWQVKVVPHKEYSSEVAIDTIGDIVRIQDYKNLQGVVVENADVAKTVREIFEMLWQKI